MFFLGPFTELTQPHRHLFIDFSSQKVFFYNDAYEKQYLTDKEFAVYDHKEKTKAYLIIEQDLILSLGMQSSGILMPKPRAYAADGQFQTESFNTTSDLKRRAQAQLSQNYVIENIFMPFEELPAPNNDYLSTKDLKKIHQIISDELLPTMQQPRLKLFQYFILRAILTGERNLVQDSPLPDALTISSICHYIRFQYLDSTNSEGIQRLFPNIHPDFIQTAIQSILLQMIAQLDCGFSDFNDFKPNKHIPKENWAKLGFFLNYENQNLSNACFNQILNLGLLQNHHQALHFLEKVCNFFIKLWRIISYYFDIGYHAQVMNQVKNLNETQQSILRQSLFLDKPMENDLKQIAHYIQFH